ncbi:MAG: heat-shock protein Hsp20 [Oceanospirillaceae bacterium]|nr:heat-shock protein Hsp20 [Oceanospirillaceae bacterium]|tara:strand:+ start:627 stop:1052 length:426 start_codon:yes stop_codon:yes gene_type:complete
MSNFLTRNSIFDDIFRDLTSGFYVKPLHGDSLPRSIRVDVTENDEVFQVQAELPGVSKENIDVKIDGAVVAIKADIHQHDSQKDSDKVLRSERFYGSVSRTFELPQSVDTEHASARFDNGVLLLTLPKQQPRDSQKQLTVQ